MTVEQLVKTISLQCNTGESCPEPLAVISIYDGETEDYLTKEVLLDKDNIPGKKEIWWNDCRKRKITSFYLGKDFKDRASLTLYI